MVEKYKKIDEKTVIALFFCPNKPFDFCVTDGRGMNVDIKLVAKAKALLQAAVLERVLGPGQVTALGINNVSKVAGSIQKIWSSDRIELHRSNMGGPILDEGMRAKALEDAIGIARDFAANFELAPLQAAEDYRALVGRGRRGRAPGE